MFSSPTTADPLFFRIGKGGDGVLVPTCYACDLVEGLLPELVTAPQVVEHLISGSGEYIVQEVQSYVFEALMDFWSL